MPRCVREPLSQVTLKRLPPLFYLYLSLSLSLLRAPRVQMSRPELLESIWRESL